MPWCSQEEEDLEDEDLEDDVEDDVEDEVQEDAQEVAEEPEVGCGIGMYTVSGHTIQSQPSCSRFQYAMAPIAFGIGGLIHLCSTNGKDFWVF